MKTDKDKIAKDSKQTNIDKDIIFKTLNIYAYRFFNVIIVIVVLIVFSASYQLLLKPKYNSILNEDQIHEKQNEYLGKMKYLIQLGYLKNAFANISQDDKDKINAIVNNTNKKEDLFKEMDYLAARENLNLDSLDVTPLDANYHLENLADNKKRSALFDRLQVVKTTVRLTDVSYEGLINALRTIELNLRIMDVNRVDYDPKNKTATIELLTYQLKK